MRSPPSRAAARCKANGQSADFTDTKSPGQWSVVTDQSAIPGPDNRESVTDNLDKAVPVFETCSLPILIRRHPRHFTFYVARPPRSRFSFSVFSTRAFTLIEMIVVMLIIMTLAALLITASAGVFDRARRAQAKNDVTQIVTAVNAYYTEYGRYPLVSTITTDAFYGTLPTGGTLPAGCANAGTNDVLLDVLRNNSTGNNSATVTTLNPRQIFFISPGGAKNTTPPRGGIVAVGTLLGQYFDPWGSPYAIEIDGGYDNLLSNPYSDSDGSAGSNPVRQGVIAYSYGKNGAVGGGPKLNASFGDESGTAARFKGSSDILSWQ